MRVCVCARFVRILSFRIRGLIPLQLLLLLLLLSLLRFLLLLLVRLFLLLVLGPVGPSKKKTRKERLPRATSFGARVCVRDKGPTLCAPTYPVTYMPRWKMFRRRYGYILETEEYSNKRFCIFSHLALSAYKHEPLLSPNILMVIESGM